MKNNLTLLLFLLATFNLASQDSAIYGWVVYEDNLEPIESHEVILIDSLDQVIASVLTSNVGFYRFENLKPGTYKIRTSYFKTNPLIITDIHLGLSESIKLSKIEIKNPCQNDFLSDVCPYCHSKKKVLSTSPYTMVSYNFGNDQKAIRKYDRKRFRKGYETYKPPGDIDLDRPSEPEEVTNVFIKGESEKFQDPCYHWFCKRCKKVF